MKGKDFVNSEWVKKADSEVIQRDIKDNFGLFRSLEKNIVILATNYTVVWLASWMAIHKFSVLGIQSRDIHMPEQSNDEFYY